MAKALDEYFPKPKKEEAAGGEEEEEEEEPSYVDIAALAKKEYGANAHGQWKTEGKKYEKELAKLETKLEKADEALATA